MSRAVRGFGLDLVHAFDASRYNEHIDGHSDLQPVPLLGRERALGIAIANTRALWPRFLEALRQQPERIARPHPLDDYVAAALRECASRLPAPSIVRLADDSGRDRVSMLHMAAASGLAHIGPCHLAVHPAHGPWIGLRALIVVDAAPPQGPAARAPDPCAACQAPCIQALQRARARSEAEGLPLRIAASWPAWVAVRDACPVGRGSRYTAEQIRYHYTGERVRLLEAATAPHGPRAGLTTGAPGVADRSHLGAGRDNASASTAGRPDCRRP